MDLREQTSKKRAATFLACVGSGAYELFKSMEFAEEGDREIDKVIMGFHWRCIGEVNITYERCAESFCAKEPFDAFVADVRRLVKSCDYGELEDSIIRDRIVIGVRDDAKRH